MRISDKIFSNKSKDDFENWGNVIIYSYWLRNPIKKPSISKNIWQKIYTSDLYFSFVFSYLFFSFRSSRLEVFCKKGVLRNFAKLTGKNLYQSVFLNKVAGQKFYKLTGKHLYQSLFFNNCSPGALLKKRF